MKIFVSTREEWEKRLRSYGRCPLDGRIGSARLGNLATPTMPDGQRIKSHFSRLPFSPFGGGAFANRFRMHDALDCAKRARVWTNPLGTLKAARAGFHESAYLTDI